MVSTRADDIIIEYGKPIDTPLGTEYSVEVTSDIATQLLQFDGNIRKTDKTKSNEYKQMMLEHKWSPRVQAPCGVLTDGRIANGHHRLDAIARQDNTITMRFVLGVTQEEFMVYDTGKNRQVYVSINEDKATVSIVNAMIKYGTGTKARKPNRWRISNLIDTYRDEFAYLKKEIAKHEPSSRTVSKLSTVFSVVVRAAKYEENKNALSQFIDGVLGDTINLPRNKHHTLTIFIKTLNKIDANSEKNRQKIVLFTEYALEQFTRDEILTRLTAEHIKNPATRWELIE